MKTRGLAVRFSHDHGHVDTFCVYSITFVPNSFSVFVICDMWSDNSIVRFFFDLNETHSAPTTCTRVIVVVKRLL